MPQTVIFLEDLGPEEKGISEMLAPDLVLFNSKYNLGLPCFYSGYRSLDGKL
jgi:hypothetical protein